VAFIGCYHLFLPKLKFFGGDGVRNWMTLVVVYIEEIITAVVLLVHLSLCVNFSAYVIESLLRATNL